MTLADDLKPIIDGIRAIPGQLGLRPNRVYLVEGTWDGDVTGEGSETQTVAELVVGDNQPPKVREMNDEQIALGNLPTGSLMIGPVTPLYSGGGVDTDDLLASAVTNGDTLKLRIDGPAGSSYFTIVSVSTDRALRRMVQAKPLGNA